MRIPRLLLVALAAAAVAAPLAAYTVVLKDGSTVAAREPYTIEGDIAIITLQNGTRTSIDAVEIDVERTRAANLTDSGQALVIDDGSLTELPASERLPRRESLSEVLARRERVAAGRSSERPDPRQAPETAVERGPVDLRTLPRRPFRNLEAAGAVQRLFRSQGVEEVLIYQGSTPDRLLLDVVANSEASVFRALEVAADAMIELGAGFPGQVAGLELVLATADRDPGGQFLLTEEMAARLAGDELDTSAFFVAHVRF